MHLVLPGRQRQQTLFAKHARQLGDAGGAEQTGGGGGGSRDVSFAAGTKDGGGGSSGSGSADFMCFAEAVRAVDDLWPGWLPLAHNPHYKPPTPAAPLPPPAAPALTPGSKGRGREAARTIAERQRGVEPSGSGRWRRGHRRFEAAL